MTGTDLPIEVHEALDAVDHIGYLIRRFATIKDREAGEYLVRDLATIRSALAAREYSKQREQETRLALDKVCALMAVPDCSECLGDGIDHEGDEWCVCECVHSKQCEEKLRARHFGEGWQCARLTPAGDLPPESEVREALRFAGFEDGVIDAALAENGDADSGRLGDRRTGA